MGRFRYLTAGESHGQGLVAIIEGMVAGLPLDESYLSIDLRRRQAGYGRSSRMQMEQDEAKFISGVRFGVTIGSPISLIIQNRIWEEWKDIMSITSVDIPADALTCPRPGHADFSGVTKYGTQDIRPILERASARETAARVAVGAVARKFLKEFGICIYSHTVSIGHHRAKINLNIDWKKVDASPLRCADAESEKVMIAEIDKAKDAGDTLGGIFEIIVTGVPIGLGSHVHWDRKLDGRIAQAIMSIQAVKGVEIGEGFNLATTSGSKAHDIIKATKKRASSWYRVTNRAGGIEGGITNGESIIVRSVVKPIATLGNPLPSMDLRTGKNAKAHYERSDICVVPSAGVIGEAMLAIVIADAVLEKFGGDHLDETLTNYRNYLSSSSC